MGARSIILHPFICINILLDSISAQECLCDVLLLEQVIRYFHFCLVYCEGIVGAVFHENCSIVSGRLHPHAQVIDNI